MVRVGVMGRVCTRHLGISDRGKSCGYYGHNVISEEGQQAQMRMVFMLLDASSSSGGLPKGFSKSFTINRTSQPSSILSNLPRLSTSSDLYISAIRFLAR